MHVAGDRGSPVPQGTRVKGIVRWYDTQEKARGHEWRMGGGCRGGFVAVVGLFLIKYFGQGVSPPFHWILPLLCKCQGLGQEPS